jgi:hypothetical protein
MRILKLLFLACIFLSCNSELSKNEKTDLEIKGLKGEVKSIRQTVYTAKEKFGEIVKDKPGAFHSDYSSYYELYNEDGNLLEENSYYQTGELVGKKKFNYDENLRLIETLFYDPDGTLTVKWIHKYDDTDNNFKTFRYNEKGEAIGSSDNEYDNAGNLILSLRNNPDGEPTHKAVYEYDENGLLIKESYLNLSGSYSRTSIYKYNEEGKSKEEEKYDTDNNLTHRILITYDSKGNKIKEVSTAYEKSSVTIFDFNLDEKENWITGVYSLSDGRIWLVERKIEYYN